MLSRDQIERELKVIEEFDSKFLAETEHTLEEMTGFRLRQIRRQELLELARSLGDG